MTLCVVLWLTFSVNVGWWVRYGPLQVRSLSNASCYHLWTYCLHCSGERNIAVSSLTSDYTQLRRCPPTLDTVGGHPHS